MSRRAIVWFSLAVIMLLALCILWGLHIGALKPVLTTDQEHEQWIISQYSDCLGQQSVIRRVTRPKDELLEVCQHLEPARILKEITNGN